MSRLYEMLHDAERPLFLHVNLRWNRTALYKLFFTLSLLGGATFTLTISLLVGLFATERWSSAGWTALAAVAISHLPVILSKKSMPRLRPYQVIPGTNTSRKPLQDPSFPSGHTTAAFAMATPFMAAIPLLIPILLPAAIGVGLSRIYFGLHYPSDCLAGALLGSTTALIVGIWI